MGQRNVFGFRTWQDNDILFLWGPPILECSIRPTQQHGSSTTHLVAVTRCTVAALQSLSPECYKLARLIHLSSKQIISSLDRQMSSQQSLVQQMSDQWVTHTAALHKLTIRTERLTTMSRLMPLVSPWEVLWGLVVASPFQTTLFVYDTLLTPPLEVNYIWRKKLKLGSILYIFARCPTLFVLLIPFPQFQTTKVSSYSTRNVQSSRNHLVRVSYRLTQCLMSNQCLWRLGPLYWKYFCYTTSRNTRWRHLQFTDNGFICLLFQGF